MQKFALFTLLLAGATIAAPTGGKRSFQSLHLLAMHKSIFYEPSL